MARVASASPELDHVLAVPTAWLPGAGSVVGPAGLDHHGDGLVSLGVGLGGISEVELGVDSDARACAPCTGDPAAEIHLARAAFRLGARENEWFTGQPALVLGVHTTIGHDRRVGQAYVVASKRLGLAALHAGAMVTDAEGGGVRMGLEVRPLVGAELTPPQYPKTTVIADVIWLPRFEPAAPALEYAFSWGVRYQALSWGSIELDVRQREGELGSPTVMVRLNCVLGYAPATR
jgi:hypothetical protein